MPRAAQAAPIPEPTAAPTDQAACIIGMRVRPAARSTAAPSTLISTSRVPIPAPVITKREGDERQRAGDERDAQQRHRGGDEQERGQDGPAAAQPVQQRGGAEQPEDGPDGHARQEQSDGGRCRCRGRP